MFPTFLLQPAQPASHEFSMQEQQVRARNVGRDEIVNRLHAKLLVTLGCLGSGNILRQSAPGSRFARMTVFGRPLGGELDHQPQQVGGLPETPLI